MQVRENVHNLLQSLQVSENVQNLFHNRSQITWKPMEMREPTHKKMGKVLTCKIFISFFTNRAAMEANGDQGKVLFILKQSKGTVLSIPEFTALSLLLI
nr:hypothetical protein Iba_scaffold2431CG1070 [Ipomoea batatas]